MAALWEKALHVDGAIRSCGLWTVYPESAIARAGHVCLGTTALMQPQKVRRATVGSTSTSALLERPAGPLHPWDSSTHLGDSSTLDARRVLLSTRQ
ncbi:hypothetical protein PVAP13_6KG166800 [Panicum virgatum]|uniref:Uncharacterized protein n=1 Tax=Panicum virgatum TaxID=38727 RepID=A0A8T0RBP9_PANVG|nr:hypothetical protein PVAP13_6KG166800 [Panicum virgatum]